MAEDVTRADLYALVWSTPMSELAKRFGISDVALRKRCKKAEIPVPGAGYWAKARAGKKVIQAKLPSRDAGMSDTISFGANRYGYRTYTDEELLGPVPDAPVFDEPLEAIRELYRARIGKVSVPKDLASAHHLIRKLLTEDEARREAQKGKSYVSLYDAPRFDSAFEQRRLRILNALLMACGRQGARPQLRGRKAREILISVYEQHLWLGLDCEADLKNGHNEYDRHERPVATPIRLASLSGWGSRDYSQSWGDTDGLKLESRIAEIAVEIFVEAEARYRSEREGQHRWRIEAKAQRMENIRLAQEREAQAERERLEKLRLARIDRLLCEAGDFQKAQAIRQYVAGATEAAHGPSAEDRLVRWSAWALAVADDVDPVTNGSFMTALDEFADQANLEISEIRQPINARRNS